MAEGQQVGHAEGGHDQPSTGNFKHAKRLKAGFARHAIDQNVGRGTNHGQGAAEDGGVGQRNQQLRGEGAGSACQGNRHRGENGHHRGVIQEG